ncbi:MAG: hypothetical protein IPJ40_18905 [Saprospirales bacterium]|nr:hypothetical protein [Saprospirales bacterium]
MFKHQIFVPFSIQGKYTVERIVAEGDYTIDEDVAVIRMQRSYHCASNGLQWPVKSPCPSTNVQFTANLCPPALGYLTPYFR